MVCYRTTTGGFVSFRRQAPKTAKHALLLERYKDKHPAVCKWTSSQTRRPKLTAARRICLKHVRLLPAGHRDFPCNPLLIVLSFSNKPEDRLLLLLLLLYNNTLFMLHVTFKLLEDQRQGFNPPVRLFNKHNSFLLSLSVATGGDLCCPTSSFTWLKCTHFRAAVYVPLMICFGLFRRLFLTCKYV